MSLLFWEMDKYLPVVKPTRGHCPFFKNEVEDKINFLLTCSTYKDLRKDIVHFSEISASSKLQVLQFLMNHKLRAIAKYTVTAFRKRELLLTK